MKSGRPLSLHLETLLKGYRKSLFTPAEVLEEVLTRSSSEEYKNIWITLLDRKQINVWLDTLKGHSPRDLPLYGIPFAIKDNIDLAGVPTTAACPEYAYIPEKSAFAVDQLIRAGAIPVGKTNMDQFAAGLVGTRSPYGIPPNSYNLKMIPGGSSSGSASAVAHNLVTFSLGTDTAGSGRVPAAFNNLVGCKPTRGRISTAGVVPACRSLDCVSLFTTTTRETERILPILSKEDPDDPYSRTGRDIQETFQIRPCFGIPQDNQLQFFGNTEYERLYGEAIERMESLGYRKIVIDASPFLKAAELLYGGPWVAERYAALEPFLKDKIKSLQPETAAVICKGNSFTALDCFRAQYALKDFHKQTERVWKEISFLLLPTTGTVYSIEEINKDPLRLNSNLGYYTNFVNLLDLSALALPAGFTDKGFPFGITLCAAPFQDEELLRIGNHWSNREGETFMDLAVCGAHMRVFPLNYQLIERGGRFLSEVQTIPDYSFYKLPTTPPKPGLLYTPGKGGAISMEIWRLPQSSVGSFLELIPAPLGLGKIRLANQKEVTGFLAEPEAVRDAEEITPLGSWRKVPLI